MISVYISETVQEMETIEQVKQQIFVAKDREKIQRGFDVCNELTEDGKKYEHFQKVIQELIENEEKGQLKSKYPQELSNLLEQFLRNLSIKYLPNIANSGNEILNLLDFIDVSLMEKAVLSDGWSLSHEELSCLSKENTFSATTLETIDLKQITNNHKDLLPLKIDFKWINSLDLVKFQKIIESLDYLEELSIKLSKLFRKKDHNSMKEQEQFESNSPNKSNGNPNIQLAIPENVNVLKFDLPTLSLIQLADISRENRFIRIFKDETNPKYPLQNLSACKNIQIFKLETAQFQQENELQFWTDLLKRHYLLLRAIRYFGDLIQEREDQFVLEKEEISIQEKLRLLQMTFQEKLSERLENFLKGVLENASGEDEWRYLNATFRRKKGKLLVRKNKQGNCDLYRAEKRKFFGTEYNDSNSQDLDWILELGKKLVDLSSSMLNLQILKIKVEYSTLQLTQQQITEIITFACSCKQLERLKIDLSDQMYTSKAYEILSKETDQLCELKIAELYLRFSTEFHDTEHLREMLKKLKTLKNLEKLELFVGGQGSEFEILAVESVACSAIQQMQIENHVKSEDTVEVFMDYIEGHETQMDLWKRIIQLTSVQHINFYYENQTSRLSYEDELRLIVQIIENPCICSFTTSDYFSAVGQGRTQPENIDEQIAQLLSLRMHFTAFTKLIRSFLSINPALVMFDLFE